MSETEQGVYIQYNQQTGQWEKIEGSYTDIERLFAGNGVGRKNRDLRSFELFTTTAFQETLRQLENLDSSPTFVPGDAYCLTESQGCLDAAADLEDVAFMPHITGQTQKDMLLQSRVLLQKGLRLEQRKKH